MIGLPRFVIFHDMTQRSILLSWTNQKRRLNAIQMQIADVRWSSTAEYGRERPAANVRGVRPGAPDQRAPGQNNRRQ